VHFVCIVTEERRVSLTTCISFNFVLPFYYIFTIFFRVICSRWFLTGIKYGLQVAIHYVRVTLFAAAECRDVHLELQALSTRHERGSNAMLHYKCKVDELERAEASATAASADDKVIIALLVCFSNFSILCFIVRWVNV
jgi:hypothetical protein